MKTSLVHLAEFEPATRGLENRIVVILIAPQNEQILDPEQLLVFCVPTNLCEFASICTDYSHNIVTKYFFKYYLVFPFIL